MNYLTLDLDNGDLVLSDNSEWKSLNTWLDGGTLYSDYYDASNCGDFWVASSHWISIDSESTYLTFTIEYEFIDATATDSCLCQIKFDGFEDGGVAVTADSSGLNISTDASKHINCDYSNANIKIDITVNLLTKEITTYIHKDNEPLAKKVNVSNYSFTEFVIQAGSRGDIVYKLPTTTKLLNLSVSDVAVSYSNFPETIDYIDKLGLVRIWANTKSYIASQLLGKSNTGHTHGNITNDGKLPTASRALISDSSKNITVSSVTDTELGYLSGVTSSVQTQLNGKAASNHVHGSITNDGKLGTTANKPLITGTGGVVQAGSFGTAANTFCEGNDSRLSDARTPVAHTHVTSDVTDLLNSNHTWTGSNTYSTSISYQSNHELGNLPQKDEAQLALKINDSAGSNFLTQLATYQSTESTGFRITIRDKFDSNGFSPSGSNRNKHFYFLQSTSNRGYLQWEGFVKNDINPYANNIYNLGTSTNQWNNLYANNYYYKGTAWGLDKANTWTAQNSFNSDLNLNYASTDVDDIVNSVAGSATLDNFVHMTGNETVSGIKSFPDGVIANVTGSATSATNDGSGNVISSTYGKLGSANTWSGDNTYSASIIYQSNHSLGNLPQDIEAQIALKIIDTAGTNYLGQVSSYQNTTSTGLRFTIRDKFDSNGLFSQNGENRNKYLLFLQNEDNRGYLQWDGFVNNGLYPLVSDNANLGSTALQWNNICAKDYYYNGTKWGLDQSNQWTKNQIISSSTGGNCFIIRTLNSELGEETPETSKMFGSFLFEDKNLANVGGFGITHFSNGEFLGRWLVRYKFTDGVKSTSGTEVPSAVDLGLSSTGESFFRPYYNSTTDLGTSTNKWKTFNGLNPGALSLPTTATADASGDIVPPSGESSINLSGRANTYTPSNNGWLTLAINGASGNCIIVRQNTSNRETLNYMQGYVPGQANIYLTIPVLAGVTYYVFLYATSFVMARFALCQGNV